MVAKAELYKLGVLICITIQANRMLIQCLMKNSKDQLKPYAVESTCYFTNKWRFLPQLKINTLSCHSLVLEHSAKARTPQVQFLVTACFFTFSINNKRSPFTVLFDQYCYNYYSKLIEINNHQPPLHDFQWMNSRV